MSATLLIEVGNTAWKVAAYRPSQQPKFLRRGYGFEALHTYLQEQDFTDLALASVAASELTENLRQFAQQQNKNLVIAETQTGFGIEHCYANLNTYGVDRWLTLLAARAEQTNAIIIDAGTAVTLDVMDDQGRHLGGWISPGFKLMQEALLQRSSKLRVATQAPSEVLGTSTENAVYLGCQAALRGFVEQALQQSQTQLADNKTVVYLTGGDLELIPAETFERFSYRVQRRPHLVLEGLARWFEQRPR